jgi:hypothetical protein
MHRHTNEARERLARIQTAEPFKTRFSGEHPNVLVRIPERLSTRST